MFLTKLAYGFFSLFAFLLFCVKYHGVDFYTYFSAAVDFSEGKRVYFNEEYLYYYPPLTAQLISPLTVFPILFLGYLLTDFHGALWHHFNHPIVSSFPTFFAIFLWVFLSNNILLNKINYRASLKRGELYT